MHYKTNTSMWIFGYGSLLWKPDFPYEERIIGHIKDYKRRFWLLNTSHRGVPEQPGRVATLVRDPGHQVWGVAYKVSQEYVQEAFRRLRCRERDYDTLLLTFYPREGDKEAFDSLLFIGSPDHPHFGPADETEIADVIKRSIGPSGKNVEYLFKLAEYVRENIPEDKDDHLFALEYLVKRACAA